LVTGEDINNAYLPIKICIFWAQTNRPEQGLQAPSDTDDAGEK
jgi:hypothetical protein